MTKGTRYRALGALLMLTISSGCSSSWFYMGQHPSVSYLGGEEHMPEASRQLVSSLQITADPNLPVLSVGGDYGDPTPTTGEGVGEGMAEGAKFAGGMVAEDPRAIIVLPVLLPVAMITGGVVGAAAAKVERELAEFREGLAEELVSDGQENIPAEVLTHQLGSLVSSTTDIELVTDQADAVLDLVVREIAIDTIDSEAVITMRARAELSTTEYESTIYSRTVEYSERRSLREWAGDNSAVWRDFSARAHDYIAADVIANLFETIHVRHVLRPRKTEQFGGGWSSRFKREQATLAWELFLLGGDAYVDRIDGDDIHFDVRILDGDRVIYEARGIEGTQHSVDKPLPDCRTLRWSVRPLYRVDDNLRAGTWMQYRTNFDRIWHNETLEPFPETRAYWQDFAEVRTRCSS